MPSRQASPTPGSIVAWWDRSVPAIGLVVAEEKGRLRLLRSRGKDERVKPSRVIAVVTRSGELPGNDPDERKRAQTRVAAAEEKLRRAAAEVEVPVVWEIVLDGRDDDAIPELSLGQLAELALDSSTAESRAAMTLALVEDGLHFVRRGDAWCPRDAEAISGLREQRAAEARRVDETREFLSGLAAAVERGTLDARGTESERRYMHALEQLAVHAEDTPEALRGPALEALEASRVGFSRPSEGAFRLLRKLGRFDSDDENLQVRRYGLGVEFPAAVVERAKERAAAGFDREGRRDLTSLQTLSIDSSHTSEIDDLLSVETRRGGGYRLGVHIADPAAFVEPDDPVDVEALSRGVTHYMPDLRIPMLPPAISEQAASLVAGEERPALTFLVDLAADGRIDGYELVPSIVRSARRLDYVEADRLIAGGDAVLTPLDAIGGLRQQARAADGAVVFYIPEVDVHVDGSGHPFLERLSAESRSRRVVSESMVLAGEVAARFCAAEGLPVGYRRQASPVELPELPPGGITDPVDVRRIRRLMRRAETGLESGPHAGLGLSGYVQASSPLRRYQDLVVHRQILSRLYKRPPCYDAAAMRRIVSTTERAESDARRAEDTADTFWLLRYLERFAGQTLDATVIDLDPRPIVQLHETLREQPVAGLAGAEPGEHVRVEVVRVEPRAGILSLRPVDRGDGRSIP